MPIHDIDLDALCSARFGLAYLFAQAREVR
jgi:hypothetical protein